jgi:hypothetical protein
MWRIVWVSLNAKEFIVIFYVGLGFFILVGETLEVSKDWKKCMDGSTRGASYSLLLLLMGDDGECGGEGDGADPMLGSL